MFFKKKNSVVKEIALLSGEAGELRVQIESYPYREVEGSLKRIEIYPDFNVYLAEAIEASLKDFEAVSSKAGLGGCSVPLIIKGLEKPILITYISIQHYDSKYKFISDILDALAKAFQENQLNR
jgi:hypothetical protein